MQHTNLITEAQRLVFANPARRAVRAFETADSLRGVSKRTVLVLLLAAIRHWCDVNSIDYGTADREAHRVYVDQIDARSTVWIG